MDPIVIAHMPPGMSGDPVGFIARGWRHQVADNAGRIVVADRTYEVGVFEN